MAKFIENPKNFKVVQITNEDTFKWGGLGVCDYCNVYATKLFYAAVLNSCYCQDCYSEWMKRAINYPEDREFEARKIAWLKNYLEI